MTDSHPGNPGSDTFVQGMQNLLMMAAEDPALEQLLLDDRERALQRFTSLLSESELRVLASIPRDSLAQMIRCMRPRSSERRAFLRRAAACVVALAAGAAFAGCDQGPGPVGGARPDVPSPGFSTEMPAPPGGARPDIPPGSPTPRPGMPGSPYEATKGIRPDRPQDVTPGSPGPIRPQTPLPNAGARPTTPGGQQTLGIRPDVPPGAPPTAAPPSPPVHAPSPGAVTRGIRPDIPRRD